MATPLSAEQIFDQLADAIDRACVEENFAVATDAARAAGLHEGDVSRSMSIRLEYRLELQDGTVEMEVRSYDQSGPFSPQPDMNKMHLALSVGGHRVRTHSKNYED